MSEEEPSQVIPIRTPHVDELGAPFPESDNPVLQIIVARALESIDTGELTVAQAILWATVNAYSEGWGDREDDD